MVGVGAEPGVDAGGVGGRMNRAAAVWMASLLAVIVSGVGLLILGSPRGAVVVWSLVSLVVIVGGWVLVALQAWREGAAVSRTDPDPDPSRAAVNGHRRVPVEEIELEEAQR